MPKEALKRSVFEEQAEALQSAVILAYPGERAVNKARQVAADAVDSAKSFQLLHLSDVRAANDDDQWYGEPGYKGESWKDAMNRLGLKRGNLMRIKFVVSGRAFDLVGQVGTVNFDSLSFSTADGDGHTVMASQVMRSRKDGIFAITKLKGLSEKEYKKAHKDKEKMDTFFAADEIREAKKAKKREQHNDAVWKRRSRARAIREKGGWKNEIRAEIIDMFSGEYDYD